MSINFNHALNFKISHDQIHVWLIDIEAFVIPAKAGIQSNKYQISDILRQAQDFGMTKNGDLSLGVSISDYISLLDPEELSRANQFKFPKDREHFIVTHSIVRILLGKYLKVEPQKIEFVYDQHKKPGLKNHSLFFNLSHSNDYALLAINTDHAIGVDIEYMKPDIEQEAIVQRFFSAHEIEEYHHLPLNQKLLGFYNAWTRKEAYVKAIGRGIFYALHQFDVTLSPDEEPKILSIEGNTHHHWQLQSFIPIENYCAAIAWQGTPKKILWGQAPL